MHLSLKTRTNLVILKFHNLFRLILLMYYLQEHLVESETDILRRVSHPNIVKFIEQYETVKEIFLVLELVKVFVNEAVNNSCRNCIISKRSQNVTILSSKQQHEVQIRLSNWYIKQYCSFRRIF